METASHDLIHEHKAISIALSVIEKMVERIRKNEEIDFKDLEDMIDFLKVFADQCHHGKEEGYFFPALEKVGIKDKNGPIGVILSEHQQGRNYIRQMQESTSNYKINTSTFVVAASSYVALLKSHIEKENNILFPIGDARLSSSEQKELQVAFEDHEEEVIGAGKHEELHALLEKFKKKYLN